MRGGAARLVAVVLLVLLVVAALGLGGMNVLGERPPSAGGSAPGP